MTWWIDLLIAIGSGGIGFWLGIKTTVRSLPRVMADLTPNQVTALGKKVAEERASRSGDVDSA